MEALTVAEVLAALAKEPAPPKNVYSATDICRALNIGRTRFPDVMRPLLASGAANLVKVHKTAIDGRRMLVTAYQLVGPRKGK